MTDISWAGDKSKNMSYLRYSWDINPISKLNKAIEIEKNLKFSDMLLSQEPDSNVTVGIRDSLFLTCIHDGAGRKKERITEAPVITKYHPCPWQTPFSTLYFRPKLPWTNSLLVSYALHHLPTWRNVPANLMGKTSNCLAHLGQTF